MEVSAKDKKHTKSTHEFIDSFASRKDELFAFYDTHSYKETLSKFGLSSYKKLRLLLNELGYDFSYKRSHSVMKGKKSSVSHEDYVKRGQKSAETQRKAWESKSDEEKESWRRLQIETHTTDEYRAKHSEIQKLWYSSLSEDEKAEYARIRGEGSKRWWDSLDEDTKKAIAKKNIENGAGWNHEKIRNTLREKYGVDNISQLDEVKRKAVESNRKTCLERYGIEFYCMSKNCSNAIGSHASNTKPNLLFAGLLDEANIEYEREFSLKRFCYDFRVDNTLIEINPTATHNSTWSPFGAHEGKDKLYHKDKMKFAQENGYECIMVWDWDDMNKIVSHLKRKERLYARKCEVREIDVDEASSFVLKYHFQDNARCKVRLGLFNGDELVSVMTFGKPRYNKNYEWELIRYCSSKSVVGGASKLFSHFVKEYRPKSVISYCDRAKFSGDLYTKLGFSLLKSGQPSKHWYNIGTKEHYTDNLIRQQGFSRIVHHKQASEENLETNDNDVLMLNEGFVEVWDCGQDVYVKSF